MSNGWAESADAWIADMGETGDFGRQYVLDTPMLERVRAKRFSHALDVGCGEGRFVRMLTEAGIPAIGIDPTEKLIAHARSRHPEGDYRLGRAEALEFADAAFDLVVSYLTLIDIPDLEAAIAEMVRVLSPGGTLLIANLTSFSTASIPNGWREDADGNSQFILDDYMTPRSAVASWRGISIENWHRPLSAYMQLFLSHGLVLRHFDEPLPQGADPARTARYRRVPWFLIMEWEKPLA
ncbi:class I SAM-dependent methyltransferase [Pelagibacterium xiamenense]|uniref:class I SAM-dependent methyltransferase n=1 Tax=Pelagibacterium xiamenense TaxID=2901140 RepID=UPI001E33E0C0|nr:class I SAM-dependent methyltransferase [Pelagibacterium xiamenense]MCD7059441.1 class I SAM-dependent methyltransferase [Pelagibacterium xiamenense]